MLDPLVSVYMQETFHSELVDELNRSFTLLENFNYPELDIDFIRLLMDAEAKHPETIQDNFIAILHEKLNEALKEHTLVLLPDANLWSKNELLTALYDVQFLVDYSNLYPILASSLEDEEKLGEVFGQLCLLPPCEVIRLIQSYEPPFLSLLTQFVEAKVTVKNELSHTDNLLESKIIANFKQWEKFTTTTDSLGGQLIRAGSAVAQSFFDYIPHIRSLLLPYTEQTPLTILSVLLLSSDGFINPVLCYRKHSPSLFTELTLITKCDIALCDWLNRFETYKAGIKPASQGVLING